MNDPERQERLRQFEERIARAKSAGREKNRRSDEHYSLANQGWRMVTELVAGILIGLGIGYGLDSLFGTMPVFLVLFLLAGLAAGVKTMLRTAEEIRREQEAAASADEGD